MATTAQLITRVNTEIAALDGTQTLRELSQLKVSALKLGIDTTPIQTRIDAIDITGQPLTVVAENAVANDLASKAVGDLHNVTMSVNSAHASHIKKGDSLVVNPNTGEIELARYYTTNHYTDSISITQNVTSVCCYMGDDQEWFVSVFTIVNDAAASRYKNLLFRLKNRLSGQVIEFSRQVDTMHSDTAFYLRRLVSISTSRVALIGEMGGTPQECVVWYIDFDLVTPANTLFNGVTTNQIDGVTVDAFNSFYLDSIVMNDGALVVLTPNSASDYRLTRIDPANYTKQTWTGVLDVYLIAEYNFKHEQCLAITPNGNLILCTDGQVLLFEYSAGVFTTTASATFTDAQIPTTGETQEIWCHGNYFTTINFSTSGVDIVRVTLDEAGPITFTADQEWNLGHTDNYNSGVRTMKLNEGILVVSGSNNDGSACMLIKYDVDGGVSDTSEIVYGYIEEANHTFKVDRGYLVSAFNSQPDQIDIAAICYGATYLAMSGLAPPAAFHVGVAADVAVGGEVTVNTYNPVQLVDNSGVTVIDYQTIYVDQIGFEAVYDYSHGSTNKTIHNSEIIRDTGYRLIDSRSYVIGDDSVVQKGRCQVSAADGAGSGGGQWAMVDGLVLSFTYSSYWTSTPPNTSVWEYSCMFNYLTSIQGDTGNSEYFSDEHEKIKELR